MCYTNRFFFKCLNSELLFSVVLSCIIIPLLHFLSPLNHFPSPSLILPIIRWWQNSVWSHREPFCLLSTIDRSQRWRHRSAAWDSVCLLQFSPRNHPSPLLIRSASSSDHSSTSRSAEGKAVRTPGKSCVRRHTNRLSGGFLRGPSSNSGSMSLTAGIRSSLSIQARKGSSMWQILYVFPACLVWNCIFIGRYRYEAAVAACGILSLIHCVWVAQLYIKCNNTLLIGGFDYRVNKAITKTWGCI